MGHRGPRGMVVHRQCAECAEDYAVKIFPGVPSDLAQDGSNCCLGCWRVQVLARAAVVGRRIGRAATADWGVGQR